MTPDEYTPTTSEVRGAYAVFGFEGNAYNHPNNHQRMDKWRAEFDRWLRDVKADVWNEAMSGVEDPHYWQENPYE